MSLKKAITCGAGRRLPAGREHERSPLHHPTTRLRTASGVLATAGLALIFPCRARVSSRGRSHHGEEAHERGSHDHGRAEVHSPAETEATRRHPKEGRAWPSNQSGMERGHASQQRRGLTPRGAPAQDGGAHVQVEPELHRHRSDREDAPGGEQWEALRVGGKQSFKTGRRHPGGRIRRWGACEGRSRCVSGAAGGHCRI